MHGCDHITVISKLNIMNQMSRTSEQNELEVHAVYKMGSEIHELGTSHSAAALLDLLNLAYVTVISWRAPLETAATVLIASWSISDRSKHSAARTKL